MATKKANKKTFQQADKLKVQAQRITDGAIQATDNLVDFSLSTTKQWQGLFAKVLKTGTTLLGNQQNMMLDTLETLKGQLLHGASRTKNLLELNTSIEPLETPLIAKIRARKEAAAKTVKKTVAKNAAPKRKTTTVRKQRKASTKA